MEDSYEDDEEDYTLGDNSSSNGGDRLFGSVWKLSNSALSFLGDKWKRRYVETDGNTIREYKVVLLILLLIVAVQRC